MQDFDNFISSLSKLISIESTLSSGEKGKPFGKNVYNSLEFYLSLAKKMGFNVKNYEGYIGEVTFGEGEELGIIGHLDVVPAGDGWLTPPFSLTKKDGVYYGRGLLDDKGPMLLILYALNELKNSNLKVNRKFRLFVGCNEESGWKDAEYFSSKFGFPEYGFSPDGNFPVVFSEKGMAIASFKLPLLKNYSVLDSGTVINAVCGKATLREKATGKLIDFNGKSCHGSRPEAGINAIKLMYEYLLNEGEDVREILDCFFYDKYMIFSLTTEQGDVTFSPDIIEEKEDGIYLKCDVRFPYPFTEKVIREKFDKFGFNYDLTVKHPTQFVDKNSFLVDKLLFVYNSVLNRNDKPMSQSGSTFARVFKKGVAFGPEFVGEVSTIHEPNECVREKDLITLYEIYKNALFELAK